MKTGILITIAIFLFSCNSINKPKKSKNEKPTICILGGTPSTKEVISVVPDSLRLKYKFVSFDRPGFGGTTNSRLTKEKLIELAEDAGLQENDFGIVGISGGAPLSILIASEMNIKHCGVICGMVTHDAYFNHADSTVTKFIMEAATRSYTDFSKAVSIFPNVEVIVKQAGANNKETALKACYDELNYILSKDLAESIKNKYIPIDWFHAEMDRNVSLNSAKEFLEDYPNARLQILPNEDHTVDTKRYINEMVKTWR